MPESNVPPEYFERADAQIFRRHQAAEFRAALAEAAIDANALFTADIDRNGKSVHVIHREPFGTVQS